MRVFKNIRVKLVLGYSSVLLISIFIIAGYFYAYMQRSLEKASREYLKTELSAVIELMGGEKLNPEALSNFLSKHTVAKKGAYRISYALFDSEGFLIARTENFFEDQDSVEVLKKTVKKLPPVGIYEKYIRRGKGKKVFLQTGVLKNSDGDVFYLQFGLDNLKNSDMAELFPKTFIFIFPISLLVSIAGGFLLTRWVMRPVSLLRQAAQGLSLTDPDKKLPLSGSGDELDRMAETFNNVLERLQQSYQGVISFTADVSHELRLPITAIKGEAEVALERERNLEEYQKILSSIIEEMDRLTRMINRLLLLTRADSGKDQISNENVNLTVLLEQLTEFFRALAEIKNISLSFLSEGKNYMIEGDPSKLQELFSNLIENALKYTPEHGAVTVSLRAVSEEYHICIIDTGIGIAREEQEKIFERFYRVDKARSRTDGSVGLGLSIAQMIARAHRGQIIVESQLNKGSCFTVILPRFSHNAAINT